MLTPDFYPLKYHPQQSKLWRTKARFVAVAAGRGSGKTELARRRVVRMLPVKKAWNNPYYFYCLPTVLSAKRIAWKEILKLVPKDWIADINKTEMRIETVFGSTLQIFGMDKPERFEGSQYDGGVLDESSDQKPDVFNRSVLPALSHRNGWCWRIGVPKRYGIGAADFKGFFDKGMRGESFIAEDETLQKILGNTDLRIESYTWTSEGIVKPEIIAFAKANLDLRDYNEQFRASWEDVGGRIFFAYDDVLNVDNNVCYHENLPLCIGSDFNVDPMAWVIGHRYKDRLEIFDELWIRNTSTQQTLDILHKKYGNHKAGFEFFGDATGRARKTAASQAAQSDYLIIRGDARFNRAGCYYPKSNPGIADRFAACNALFCNVDKVRRCIIHPRCNRLRKDLLTRAYAEGSRLPDDSGDIGHITDALGYIIHRAYPLISQTEHKPGVSINGNS